MKPEEAKALDALRFVIPLIESRGFKWIVTGGFATYAYGVDRPITDIDIDIEAKNDDPKFQEFLAEAGKSFSLSGEHNQNDFYDNWSYEIDFEGQIIDICPSKNLFIKNKQEKAYQIFYPEGMLPEPEVVEWKGIKLNLLPKMLVIRNKMMIMRDQYDQRDIDGLMKLPNKA